MKIEDDHIEGILVDVRGSKGSLSNDIFNLFETTFKTDKVTLFEINLCFFHFNLRFFFIFHSRNTLGLEIVSENE